MKTLEIRMPIWKVPKSIGINEKYLKYYEFLVNITYKDVRGERLYPHTYIVNSEKLKNFPTQTVKGAKLYIIPISDLKIYDIGATLDL